MYCVCITCTGTTPLHIVSHLCAYECSYPVHIWLWYTLYVGCCVVFPQAGSGERVDVTLVDINIDTGEVSVSVVGRGTRRLADLVDLINSTYSNKVGTCTWGPILCMYLYPTTNFKGTASVYNTHVIWCEQGKSIPTWFTIIMTLVLHIALSCECQGDENWFLLQHCVFVIFFMLFG